MEDSLREQFLKLGLANEEQVKRLDKPKKRSKPRHSAKSRHPTKPAARREAKPVKKIDAVEAAAKKKQAGLARKALFQTLRKMAMQNRLNSEKADIPFYFQHAAQAKKIYLTAEQKTQLLANELCIVNVKTRYHLMTPEIAQQMYDILPETRVELPKEECKPAADDPYAKYDIPDDLMW